MNEDLILLEGKMIAEFNPFEAGTTWFQALNVLLTAATSILLFAVFQKARFLIIKPSIWLFTVCHVLMQWPMTVYSVYYQSWLPNGFEFFALVHGTIVGGLLISLFLFRPTAQRAWAHLNDESAAGHWGAVDAGGRKSSGILPISLMGALLVVAIGLYLAEIPFQCTGLYALVAAPEAFPLAREISLKLVQPIVPRYAMTIVTSALAPLLTGLLVLQIIKSGNRLRPGAAILICVAVLFLVWVLADLTGAKGVLVTLSLVAAFTFLWWRRFSVNPLVAGAALACALMPAVMITSLIGATPFLKQGSYDIDKCLAVVGVAAPGEKRGVSDQAGDERRMAMIEALVIGQDKTMSPKKTVTPSEAIAPNEATAATTFEKMPDYAGVVARYLDVLKSGILSMVYRAGVVPLQTGGWFVHYEQTAGPIGVGGVTKLAKLLGVPVIDAPNLIGRIYGPIYYGHAVSPTISATASFVFANYMCFGLAAIAVNIVLILLLDIALFVFVRVDAQLLVPLLGALTPVSLKFVEAEYPTVWLTHGYGIMLLLAFGLTLALGFRQPRVTALKNG